MTQDEIIEMAQECKLIGMRPFIDGIYTEALIEFAKLVAAKERLENSMREVQRLGQEIEQEPVAYLVLFEGAGKLLEFTKGNHLHGAKVEHIPLYTAPPQRTEQEPVAWINAEKRTFEWNGPVLWNTPTVAVLNKIPLYTHPPQRTWVGLTDDDKQIAFDDTQEGGGFWEFADAIEAKLKQKNGYAEEKNT